MAYVAMQKKFDLDTVITLKVPNAIISSATTTTQSTPYISMAKSFHLAFIMQPLDTTLAGAVTAWLLEATGSTTGLKTGTPLGTTSWSAGTGDLGIKILEVESAELDVANGYDFVALKVKTAGADSWGVHLIRGPNRYDPASLI
jgi:hypothetical protein